MTHVENTQVGPFLVLQKVGPHRRHNVYHARQTEQDRDVALKFIKLPRGVDRETALAKINHESQVVKRLQHVNIVKLYGAGTHEDKVFFAHELVDGESLYALLSRLGRMAPDLVIDYGAQLANALDYLHQNELIHNNLSTDKVIVTPDGRVKLSDIRMNRPRKRRWDAPKRATLETAAYMSPEQLLGEGSTPKSDVYSLGVLLYEMVTGKLPFDPKTMGLLARDKQSNKVAKVTDHVMNCPAWLDKLIMQMIRSDPRQRPHSAKAVALTLDQIRTVDQSKASAAVEMTRGFSALTAGTDQAEARKLLGKKTIEEDKPAGPLMQSLPFLIGGLVMLSLITALIVFWPFSMNRGDMMTEANQLMLSSDPQDWQKARGYFEKLSKSSDEEVAAEARQKYKLLRRKSMLYRLDRGSAGLSGLNRAEIREFSRGYELQKQRKPDEALAFFQRFVSEYDVENQREYVLDEAKERLGQLLADKKVLLEKKDEIESRLSEADELAKSPETLDDAHAIWTEILDEYQTNDFLQLQTQRAETGKMMFPKGSIGSAGNGNAVEEQDGDTFADGAQEEPQPGENDESGSDKSDDDESDGNSG